MPETRVVAGWKTVFAVVLCAAFMTSACGKKLVRRKTPPPSEGPLAAGSTRPAADLDGGVGFDGTGVDVADDVPDMNVSEASIRDIEGRVKEFANVPDLEPVYFGYDRYSLSRKGKVALRNNASYLKAHPDLEVLVEGHCDERGTLEYNLALGQKRAKAVRDYYMRLGVPGKSIATLSFGEEQPVCKDQTEDCWEQNRRGISKIRAQVSSTGSDNHRNIP